MANNSAKCGKYLHIPKTAKGLLSLLVIFTSTRTICGSISPNVKTSSDIKQFFARRWKIDACFQNKRNYDITFLIDTAVKRQYLRYNQRLLSEITRRINILRSQPKIAFITYGMKIDQVKYKSSWQRHSELRDLVNSFSPSGPPAKRNVALALSTALQRVKFRENKRNFVLLFVGGSEAGKEAHVKQNIDSLREKAATIIVVGYDKANPAFVSDIARHAGTNHGLYVKAATDLVQSTDAIMSMMCEELLNGFNSGFYNIKKKTLPAQVPRVMRPDVIYTTPGEIHLEWTGEAAAAASRFRVTWLPRDGSQSIAKEENQTMIKITNLRPATIYKLTMVPATKNNAARSVTVITATSPEPVSNLSARVKLVEPCSLQKQLLKIHRGSKVGLSLKPTHCDSNRAVVFVEWNRSSNSKFYMMNTVPKTARLIRVTRLSTEQYLANVSPGQEYTLSVVARGPQLLSSEIRNTSVVVPPVDPIRVDVAVTNWTAVVIRWQMPAKTIYDGFKILAISAYGKKVTRVDATRPTEITIRPFYSFVMGDLRPDTDYELIVMAVSRNVTSPGERNVKFSTKSPSDLYNESFLIISGGDGIYAAVATKDEDGMKKVERLLPVAGGVVNSLYHSRWVEPKWNVFSSGGTFGWQKLVIWISRNSREIKMTDLTNQKETITLVSGLLQPVGLAIDPYGETIYWTDIGSRSIGVVSMANRPGLRDHLVNRNLVTGDMETPVSVAVAVVDRLLFWGDLQGQIERSNLDGSGRIVVFRQDESEPYSLSVCEKTKSLFWIDGRSGGMNRLTINGNEHEVLYSVPSQNMYALVVAGPVLVWFDEETTSFLTLPKRSKEEIDLAEPETLYENAMVPAITSITTFDPEALEKGYGMGITTLDLLLSLMRDSSRLSFPCHGSVKCNGVCIPVTMKRAVCSSDCEPWELVCYKSNEKKCVDKRFACDGNHDCPDGEDEEMSMCAEIGKSNMCTSKNYSEFKCHDTGKCIPLQGTCNGRLDCADGSDEKTCLARKEFCNFESKDLCLWKQDRERDDFDWIIHSGKTPSNHTGPLMDHTKLTVNGSYLYLEATPHNEGDTAKLVSVFLDKPVCVTFYYYMHGETTGQLNLMQRDHNSGLESMLWSKSGDQGAIWNKVQVSVDEHSLYQLAIEGVRGADYRSDIAVDDISIEFGLCEVPRKCDFASLDDAMCGYQLGENWKKVSGNIVLPGSKIEEPVLQRPTTQDLSSVLGPEWFYYDFPFDDFPGCTDCNGTKLVRDISNTKYGKNGVNFVGVTLCSRSWYKLYLSEALSGPFRNIADGAGKGEDHCEFIGSDEYARDIGNFKECEGNIGFVRRRWSESLDKEPFGFHRSRYFGAASYDCSFDFPQYVIDNDPLQWLKKLPNSYILLDFSHFIENEYRNSDTFKIPVFLPKDEQFFVEEEFEFLDPKVFTLAPSQKLFDHEKVTPLSSISKSWCLKFRYFMVGSDVGKVNISINDDYEIWVKNGPQGEMWKDASVDIPFPATKYDIVFTASRSGGYEGSIGVDDVEIQYEPCGQKTNYKCSFDVVLEEECSFSITENPAEQVIFETLYEKRMFSPDIVKERKHSSGVISGQKRTLVNDTDITSKPVLKSPLLPKLSQFYPVICLTIDYRQRSEYGELSVDVRNEAGRRILTLAKHQLPHLSTSQIRPWLTYAAQIDDTLPVVVGQPFYLEFHGLNATWVNELSLDTAECSKIVGNQCYNQVKCKNENCVRPEFLCDGIDDCGDWSDEIGCPSSCGNVADYFDTNHTFDRMQKIQRHTCTFRIHGQSGKHVLLTVQTMKRLPTTASITMTVYEGFARRLENSASFTNGSLVFTTDDFSTEVDYLIESHNVTVVITYSSLAMSQVQMSYKMVEKGHCSLVCPDRHCLFSNYFCDGIIGCSDGSDERNCARIVEKDGLKIAEVKFRDGPFTPICADDIDGRVADALCKQFNDLHAERPLIKAELPPSYDSVTPYRLVADSLITGTTLIQSLIQTTMPFGPVGANASNIPTKITERQCKSREMWIPNCVSYQCGVRSMDANPFLSQYGGLSPMLRVVGGGKSKKGMWPWIASMMFKGVKHNCGGTLISDRHIITAAHCFDDNRPSDFTVLLGAVATREVEKQTTKHSIKRLLVHDMYNKRADIPDYDIAMIEITPPAHFSTFISPICVPQGLQEFPPGTDCHIAGFGYEMEGVPGEGVLNEAATPIISSSECDTGSYRNSITDRMVCAGYPNTGGIGICHGDSGGPLMCKSNDTWFLVGVTSWSIGCANKDKPDVFSRILSYIGWINEHTGSNYTVPDRSKNVVGTCGGRYYGSKSGSFASPGWPNQYGHDVSCTYIILANLGQVIHLRFEEFETEDHFDKITIFTGNTRWDNAILREHSGISKPKSINARTGALYIVFKSDETTNEKGFVGNWEISGNIAPYEGAGHPIQISVRGQIGSYLQVLSYSYLGMFVYAGVGAGGWPYYLQHPPRQVTHKLSYVPRMGYWTIRPLTNHVVDPNVGMRTACVHETPDHCFKTWEFWTGNTWVEIDLHLQEKEGSKMAPPTDVIYSTTSTPEPIPTTKPPVTVTGLPVLPWLTTTSGQPATSSNANVPTSSSAAPTVTSSQLEDENLFVISDLSFDSNIAGASRNRRSAGIDPSYFYMDIGSGFDFEYEYDYVTSFDQAKPDADCNFSITLNSTESRISYFIEKQEGIEYDIRRCFWTIKPQELGHNITLDVELSPYTDGIIAYSFMAGNDDEMIRIDIAPRNILTRRITVPDELLIYFNTDGASVGFNATLKLDDSEHIQPVLDAIPTKSTTTTSNSHRILEGAEVSGGMEISITSSCENATGKTEDDEFYIQSPNHPLRYEGNEDCMYVLKASSSQKIVLSFIRMSVEMIANECSYDNVSVYDEEISTEPIGVFCGDKLPEPVVSKGSVMVVRFLTDKLIQHNGFRALIMTIGEDIVKRGGDKTMFSCDFDDEEADLCGFSHDRSDDVDFIWTKNMFSTISEKTGPPHDASISKDGYYLFIEASMPRMPGDRARLMSPVFRSKPREEICLSFAYSMKGQSVGSLVVYVLVSEDGVTEDTDEEFVDERNVLKLRPIVSKFGAGLDSSRMKIAYGNISTRPDWQQYVLWSRSGEQSDEPWLEANVTFTPNNHFQLVFEGIRGKEYQSDIAIDNVVVTHGACENERCPERYFKCNIPEANKQLPVCVSDEVLCDGHYDCSDGSDEEGCIFPLSRFCQEEFNFNTTEYLICNNLHKCSPTRQISSLRDIICDGVYDCFGGHDESSCGADTHQFENEKFDHTKCDSVLPDDEEITQRTDMHNIPPESMPFMAGLYIHAPGHDPSGETEYIFLCSATFIYENWLLIPSHCILDPEFDESNLREFLREKDPPRDVVFNEPSTVEETDNPSNTLRYDSPFTEEIPDRNELRDLYKDEFVKEEFVDHSKTAFEYYVISPPKNAKSSKQIYHVLKLVPHPRYAVLEDLELCNSSKWNETFLFNNATVNCDTTRTNYDIALVKIDREINEDEQEESSRACLANPLHSDKTAHSKSTFKNNFFKPASERVAFKENFKQKTTCYAVGYSFHTNSESQFPEDLTLSRRSIHLVYGDHSSSQLLCGMQRYGQPRECLEIYRENSSLHPLLIGGYQRVRDSPFMYDGGSVVMCKSWDEKWYLTGLYSWMNFYRNRQQDRLFQIPAENDILGGVSAHGLVIGVPLGVDLFMDVSHVANWVRDTLNEDCPGEFPCYDKSSSLTQKCIPKHKQCDGIIDCPSNYADEINCASGCNYEPEKDPFHQYYQVLEEYGVDLPPRIAKAYNLSSLASNNVAGMDSIQNGNPKSIIVDSRDRDDAESLIYDEDNEKSWRGGTGHGTIRVNVVEGSKRKMCIWTIKAPEDEVVSLQVKEFNSVEDGNRIQIVNSEIGTREFLSPGMKDLHYTSKVGGTLTVRILPPLGQLYLSEIRYLEVNHQTEPVGLCENRHRCGDDSCVSPHHVCDGFWNCGDRSDEMNCSSGCDEKAYISGPSSGYITSKNYPFHDGGNGDCEWQFVSDKQDGPSEITFEFVDFRTDITDSLFLLSGAGIEKSAENLLGVYHGEKGSFRVKFEAKSATMFMKSNDFVWFRKFKIKYSIDDS